MRIFIVIFCVLVSNAFAQSEILYKFLNLNRENLTVSGRCENDLQILQESLESGEIWAMKSEFLRFYFLNSIVKIC